MNHDTPEAIALTDKAAAGLMASEKALQVKHTCCKKVGTWLTSTCGRTAKANRDGKWFCGTHDPVAVAEKSAKRNVKWRAKYDADKAILDAKYAKQAEIERRADCYTELLEALHDLEVSANTAIFCYNRNPGNFAAALTGLAESAKVARAIQTKATGEQA